MPAKPIKQSHTDAFVAAFQKLHSAFTDLMSLQPWTIVDESVILAVQHPENGEVYYAYFMGELGEVVGFNLYRGQHVAPWLASREAMTMNEEDFSPSDMLSHTFYQLTANKKTGLPAEFKDIHAAAGITVARGKAGYLEAISYRGGYAPVMMDEDQMIEIASLLPGFDYILNAIDANKLDEVESLDARGACYVAILQADGSWQVTEQRLPEPQVVNLFEVSTPERAAWAALKMLPKSKEPYLLHAQLFPMPVANDAGVGFFPLALLCVGVESQLILGMKLLEAGSWKDAALPALQEILQDGKALPAAIHIADKRLLPMASVCAEMLGLEVFRNDGAGVLLDDIFESLGAGMGF